MALRGRESHKYNLVGIWHPQKKESAPMSNETSILNLGVIMHCLCKCMSNKIIIIVDGL